MRLPWAVALLLLLGLRYLLWRATDTLNLATPLAAVISLTALTAEVLLLGSGFLTLLLSLWLPGKERQRQRSGITTELPAPQNGTRAAADPGSAEGSTADAAMAAQAAAMEGTGALPAVDVLVPSYGEPPALVEACLRACLDLDHPGVRVWLLDDSGRPELEALCRQLGASYLAREDRRHAKAGNLNHALPHLSGELIAVFDADVLPLRSFLRHTVPCFADPTVGFVQTPQTYRNADPVMRNLGLERWLMPDEESFYRWIEPCRDAVGAVVCAGTSFVMRRAALERVGGFETGTPSEDLATGIRITAAGYHNRFLPHKLSAGLAPLTAAALARQRCRWASGTLQVLRTGANPLTIPGLNPLQRLGYLEGIVHWLMPLPQLLLALMPLSLGVLGVAPLRLTGAGLLLYALPFALAQLLLTRWLSGHSRTAVMPELYRWIVLLPLAGTVLLTLLGRPQRFRVTPKALASGRSTSPARRLLLPLLGLLSLQLVSLIHLLRPSMAAALAPLSGATLALSLGWAVLNLLLLTLALRACFDRPGLREPPWYSLPLACRLHQGGDTLPAELEAISEAGVELRLRQAGPLPAGGGRPLTLSLPALELEALPLNTRIQRGRRFGAHWGELSPEQRQALRRALTSRDNLWPIRRAPAEPLALGVVLQRLLLGCPPEGWFRRSLMPSSRPQAEPAPHSPEEDAGLPGGRAAPEPDRAGRRAIATPVKPPS